jgi:hypothetical protein
MTGSYEDLVVERKQWKSPMGAAAWAAGDSVREKA